MAAPLSSPADQPSPESGIVQGTTTVEQNMNNGESLAGEDRPQSYAARVRNLNDRFRQSGAGGRMLMTAGIAALPRDERLAIVAAVMAFDAFDPGDDPYGEHDFGSLRIGLNDAMFKIDTYDRSERVHSPDPSDAAVTSRIMTIMLAEEY